jgi:hypothetical protein
LPDPLHSLAAFRRNLIFMYLLETPVLPKNGSSRKPDAKLLHPELKLRTLHRDSAIRHYRIAAGRTASIPEQNYLMAQASQLQESPNYPLEKATDLRLGARLIPYKKRYAR